MTYHRRLDAAWGGGDEIASPDFRITSYARWGRTDAFRAGAYSRQLVCTDAPPRQLDADLRRSAMPDGTLGDYHGGGTLNYTCSRYFVVTNFGAGSRIIRFFGST